MIKNLSTLQIVSLSFILLLNMYSFSLFFIDKRKAVKKSRQRISEKRLLTSAYFLGGIGAFLGTYMLRHKTKKLKFKINIPIAMVITIAILFGVIYHPLF